ncbi:phospholipid-transporting ATPase ABCA3-like isoform X2 [Oratosquilla oratoria]
MAGCSAGLKRFGLLLWKNWILQKRKKIQTVVEVVLPIVFCVLLVVIRDLAPSDTYPQPTFYTPFGVSTLPANLTPSDTKSFLDKMAETFFESDQSRRRRRSLPAESIHLGAVESVGQPPPPPTSPLSPSSHLPPTQYSHPAFQEVPVPLRPPLLSPKSKTGLPRTHPHYENINSHYGGPKERKKRFLFGLFGDSLWPIAYTPNNTAVTEVMKIVADLLYVDIIGYGFATEEEMVQKLTTISEDVKKSSTFSFYGVEDVLGGIVFTSPFPKNDTFPDKIEYKIRLKGTPRHGKKHIPFAPPPQWLTQVSYPLFQVPGPRGRNDNTGGIPGYYDEGFLALQHTIDMAIAEYISGKTPQDWSAVELQRMPYPSFIDDKYLVALQAWLPLILLLSYIYPAINIVKSVVHEKEKRLKESMKMMGLPGWLHWSAWLVKSFFFLLASSILICILLCTRWNGSGSLAVLDNSDPSLVFFFLIVYILCSISFCFFMSTLFSKANSAAMGAGLIWFFTYVPYMFLRPRYAMLSQQSKLLLCLLSNTAMSFGCQLASMFEGTAAGIQWSNLSQGVSPDDTFTLAHVYGMLFLDTIIYSLLAWYIEAVFPGEYGVPLPWYFPFMKSYWLGTVESEHGIAEAINTHRQDPDYFEDEPANLSAGIRITGLTKVFLQGKKVAVNNIHLTMYEGQITALLGHNGAGKTTTMSMLTGLFPPSKGTATVGGYDIVTEVNEVRRSLGLCPQHDVLFDELTVAEHIIFFSRLKGLDADKVDAEVTHMVEALNLADKIHAPSRTLSGGMKRKLSVGIALCAGSRVVMLDEPTSGMDPEARRATWDLLQQERSGRTIVLTTHFMEEADLLGDRIAIMSGGVLQCSGSSLFLKKRYGAGYRLTIVKEPSCEVSVITNLLQDHIPDTELDQNVGSELSYILPSEKASKFEDLFSLLEDKREELKISSYGASLTTMEEVFLRVGEVSDPEMKSHLQRDSKGNKIKANSNLTSVTENGHLLTEEEQRLENNPVTLNGGAWYSSAIQRVKLTMDQVKTAASNGVGLNTTPRRTPLQRNTGLILVMQQFWAMLVKKVLHTARNWLLSLTQLVIPVVFLILALVVVKSLPGVNDTPPELRLDLGNFHGTETVIQVINPNNYTDAFVTSLKEQLQGPNVAVPISSSENISTFILTRAEADLPSFNLHWMVAVQLTGDSYGLTATTFFNNQPFHTPPIALGIVDLAIVRSTTGNPNLTITTINHPLPRTDTDKLTQDSRQNLGFQIGFNLAFGMSFLAASFVLFLVKEHVGKSKHLQFVSGVHFATYWASAALWDFINFMIPCALIIICLKIYGEDGLSEPDQLGRMAMILALYAWVTLPLMYLFSFLFNIPSSGFTRMTMFNIFTGMATLITVTILRIPELDLTHVADILDWVFLLLPSYSLAAAITDLYTNSRSTRICSKEIIKFLCSMDTFANPCCKETGNCGTFGCVSWTENYLSWEKLGIGRMLVFMGVESIFFYLIITLIEMKVSQKLWYFWITFYRKLNSKPKECINRNEDPEKHNNKIFMEDGDVLAERHRISNASVEQLCKTDKLILRELCKSYNGEFLAVDHLSLGIPLGECFGLLGVNGAGKTTTFKMLTGDHPVSSGNAYVNGFSIRSNIKKVQQQIGYCPQFDALIDQMTGKESLRMFARLRGVPEGQIDEIISDLADQLLLTPHLNTLIKNHSGGNRRKVSTGVALIGDPPLVLLDEPTTGMDPVARRLLWDVLSNFRDTGRSIILTSHSMEECEALCTRLAIMVNGRFRCLGSPQHLKSKFGDGYSLIIRVRVCSSTTIGDIDIRDMPQEMTRVKNFVESTFPACVLRDLHLGLLHYHIPADGMSWGKVFGAIERNRVTLEIEDYSVSQTTLEQVFLNFARGQRPENESSA